MKGLFWIYSEESSLFQLNYKIFIELHRRKKNRLTQ
jgi:hypothetical protein